MPTSEYPNITAFQLVGDTANPLVGSPIASSATIAPTYGIHHVTGAAAINTITLPWTGFSGSLFLIADGAWTLATGGNINSALTAAAGNIITCTYDPSNAKWYPVLASSSGGSTAPLVLDNTGAGDGVPTLRKTMSGSSAFSNFLLIQGTFPSVLSSQTEGVLFQFTTAGSSAQFQVGLETILGAGYTGAGETAAGYYLNQAAGTALWSAGLFGGAGNKGIRGQTSVVTTGTNFGVVGNASSGDICVGVYGSCLTSKNSGTNIGVVGLAGNAGTTPIRVGGYFGLNSSSVPTFVESALIADNEAVAVPIFIARDNGTAMFIIDDGGNYKYDRTITTVGTTGNQTINKAVGTVNIAAAGTTVTVTNSLVNTSSIIFCTIRTNDATARLANVVPGSGSFVINIVACTAEVSIGFMVTN